MNRLEVNFAARGRRSPWAARVLFAVALAMGIDAALSYRQVSASLQNHEAKLAQAQPRSTPPRKLAPEELAAVRETLDRLAMPWDQLFGALEGAATEQVALLGLEPDPKAGTVLISGDSKDYLAVLSYVLNLSQADALQRVQLVRHELKGNDPQGAVSFAVSAGWSEAKR